MTPLVISQTGTSVRVSFSQPSANGSPITNYTIVFLDYSDLSYKEFTSLCDGSVTLTKT